MGSHVESLGRNPRIPSRLQTNRWPLDRSAARLHKRLWGPRFGPFSKIAASNTSRLVGVHTNMCVLGRPFGLRQLASHGKQVAYHSRYDRHDVRSALLALRQSLFRHRLDRRSHRASGMPDLYEQRYSRRSRIPFAGDLRPKLVIIAPRMNTKPKRRCPSSPPHIWVVIVCSLSLAMRATKHRCRASNKLLMPTRCW